MVEPEAEILVLCPICTHNMRFSSYVLSPEHSLTVTMEGNGRKPIYLFVDESRAFSLRQGDRVVVRRSKHVTRLVRLSERVSARSSPKKCCQEDTTMKNDRQNTILEIIAAENIETQEQLLDRLAQRGIRSTQATISRDIKQMHLIKEPVGQGVYRYAVSVNRARLNVAD